MTVYIAMAGLVLAMLAGAAGIGIGKKLERGEWVERDLKVATKTIERERVIAKEVPVIVTKYVEKRVEIEKEVPRVVEIIRRDIAPDCVLPPRFAGVLIDFARASSGEPARGADEADAAYGCREVLAAVTKDLAAGFDNSAKGAALQRWATLVSKP